MFSIGVCSHELAVKMGIFILDKHPGIRIDYYPEELETLFRFEGQSFKVTEIIGYFKIFGFDCKYIRVDELNY